MGGRRLGGPQHSHRSSSGTGSPRRSSRHVQHRPARSKARGVPSSHAACGPLKGASTAELTIHQIRRRAGPLFSMIRARETRSPSSIVSVRVRIWASPGPDDNEHWRTRDLGRRVARRRRLRGASTSPTLRRTPRQWTLFPTCSIGNETDDEAAVIGTDLGLGRAGPRDRPLPALPPLGRSGRHRSGEGGERRGVRGQRVARKPLDAEPRFTGAAVPCDGPLADIAVDDLRRDERWENSRL